MHSLLFDLESPLCFKLLPCPACGEKLTLGNIRQTGENTWILLHSCPAAPLTPGGLPQQSKGIICTGENLRMTVQKWNKYARERTP